MGKEVRGVPEAASLTDAGHAPDEPAIGPFLARQRRLRGITIAELSARTKIPLRSLERLEAGAFDHTADGFARGFVRTVADALGLDPDDAVMRLLREPPDEDGLPRSAPSWADARSLGRLAVLGAAAVLVVGVLALALWGLGAVLGGDGAPAAADAEVLYRRDAVRDLAASLSGQAEPDAEAAPDDAAEARAPSR